LRPPVGQLVNAGAGGRRELAASHHARLLERVNATGEIFISHCVLNGRYTLRLGMGR
jgi:hypothetical protein